MGRLRHAGGREHVLGSEQVVGRSPSCAFRLEGETVSGVHAILRWGQNRWEVRDLGSRNGTTLGASLLVPGEFIELDVGAELSFGDGEERWALIDSGPPVVQAVPLDGLGPSIPIEDGLLALPTSEHPLCTVYQTGSEWMLEEHGELRSIINNQTFIVDGRALRFECPRGITETPATTASPMPLRTVCLCFRVSSDEESVELLIEGPGSSRVLENRSCFYLAATLARQRLRDAREGCPDPGWLCVAALLQMLPDYSDQSHLNVDVHRLRKELGAAHIIDAGNVVERRRGYMRIGTPSLRVERVEST